MIRILRRYLGRQHRILLLSPATYAADTYHIFMQTSPRFTLRWDKRHIKHGATRLYELGGGGGWIQIDDDELDSWLWQEIKSYEQRKQKELMQCA